MASDRAFEDAVHTTLLLSPVLLSSNAGSPYHFAPDLERTVSRSNTMEEKINEIFEQNCKIAATPTDFFQNRKFRPAALPESGFIWRKIHKYWANRWQLWSPCYHIGNECSVSIGSGSVRSSNILGHGDGSTATGSLGSHGPGSSDDKRNTRRRLDIFSRPELRIGPITIGKNPTCQPLINPSEFIAKQVPYPDSYSKQEPSVRTLLPDIETMVSLPELDGTGYRATTMEEKLNEIYLQLSLFLQKTSRNEDCVQALSQTVAAQTTKITSIEQIAWSLSTRVTTLETGAAPGSIVLHSARSWTVLGHVTALQSLGLSGPMAQGQLMTIEIRGVDLILSQAPKDEHARSAVLLQFPCEQYRAGVSMWINSVWDNSNIPAYPPDPYSKPVRNATTYWFDTRKMESPAKLMVHFAMAEPTHHSPPVKVSWRSRNRKTICTSLESFVHKVTWSLPRRRWYRYLHCPHAQYPFTRS